ncbi:hypothetical protein OJ997_32815 [Solirubrobacter phytolaccae]|uniref:Uncharacterized protein n=1 Tax=Solirubrobacter phytolaccae TaxID=1404360 RepID=A0A9X3SBW3_9ACTN|nr:hypothetical protein [Solirubrobacter phytolaccae]MDA0185133.1 hypothetical protein [Solirubrobacter phytolaccae]
MRALRVASCIVLFAASVFVIGSGIAAIPYGENEPCIEFLTETGPGVDWVIDLVPYGTRCVQASETVRVVAPSTGEWLAWLAVITALLAVAVRWRRFASVRGLGLAAGVLGLLGLLAHQAEGGPAMMGAVVFSAPLVLAGDRLLRPEPRWPVSFLLCVTLPFVVIAVWFAPGYSGFHEVAVAAGLLAGAGVAAVVERAPVREWWRVIAASS